VTPSVTATGDTNLSDATVTNLTDSYSYGHSLQKLRKWYISEARVRLGEALSQRCRIVKFGI